MRDHVEQPALTLGEHLGDTLDRRGQQPAVPHDAKPPGTLRDEHVAVRQERHGPRIDQAVGDRHDAEVVVRRAVDAAAVLGGGGRGERKRQTSGDSGHQRYPDHRVPSLGVAVCEARRVSADTESGHAGQAGART